MQSELEKTRIMKIKSLFSIATIMLTALSLASCNNRKFHVDGEITNAKDSTLYFENMSLNGPVVVDSVKLGEDGSFSFSEKAPEAPDLPSAYCRTDYQREHRLHGNSQHQGCLSAHGIEI